VARNGELNGPRDNAVLSYPVGPEQSRIHPAYKPTGLMRYLIAKATTGTVFDGFMGSGSTGVATVQMGREFIGAEIDPAHFETACKRIDEAQRQGSMFDYAL